MAGNPKDDVCGKNDEYPAIEPRLAGIKALVSESMESGFENVVEGRRYPEGSPENEDCSKDEGNPKDDSPARSNGMSDAIEAGEAAARAR